MNANTNIFNETTEYVLSTKRFEEPLFQWSQEIFKQGYEPVNYASLVIFTCLFFYLYPG